MLMETPPLRAKNDKDREEDKQRDGNEKVFVLKIRLDLRIDPSPTTFIRMTTAAAAYRA